MLLNYVFEIFKFKASLALCQVVLLAIKSIREKVIL